MKWNGNGATADYQQQQQQPGGQQAKKTGV